MNKHHYVAIMAGGIGSRFWPMSRTAYPKQFLDILHTGKSLIQWTFERYKTFIPLENIYIVTSEEYVSIVKEQLPELPAENILVSKNIITETSINKKFYIKSLNYSYFVNIPFLIIL